MVAEFVMVQFSVLATSARMHTTCGSAMSCNTGSQEQDEALQMRRAIARRCGARSYLQEAACLPAVCEDYEFRPAVRSEVVRRLSELELELASEVSVVAASVLDLGENGFHATVFRDLRPVLLEGLIPAKVPLLWTEDYQLSAIGNRSVEFQILLNGTLSFEKKPFGDWLTSNTHQWKLNHVQIYGEHIAGDALLVGNQLVSDLHVVIRNLSTSLGLNLLQIDVHAGFEGHRHLPLHHDANTTNIACQISGDKTWLIYPPTSATLLDAYGNSDCSVTEMSLESLTEGQCAHMQRVRVRQGHCIALPKFWWHQTVYHSPEKDQASATGLSICISMYM